jgi:hypothetical protein
MTLLNPSTRPSFIVLYAVENDAVWIDDPGLPPHRAEKLPLDRVYGASGDLIVIPTDGHRFGPPKTLP